MALEIIWTETAQKDREDIFEYWNEHIGSSEYSQKLNRLIENRLEISKIYPNAGLATNQKNIRFHLIDNHYKLFYKITEEYIIVMRFWDTRQDPGTLKI